MRRRPKNENFIRLLFTNLLFHATTSTQMKDVTKAKWRK